ncbi:MAG: hypothetical protein K2W95_12435 [Candidatus Obscuribacterales bacterium]|nr:hypothetical protein [Candidatus Obscuribacterales bacterium]
MQEPPSNAFEEKSILKMLLTDDGSYTLFDSESGELFHNRAGALTEALHNYLKPSRALDTLISAGQLRVLDVCFGLGYNSFVLLEEALRTEVPGRISIVAIEKDPAVLAMCTEVLKDERLSHLRNCIGERFPQSGFTYENGFITIEMQIMPNDFRTVITELTCDFDLVFHDPFSPRNAAQLWTVDIFKQYQRLLESRSGAVLTYSSAVAVRSALRMTGFDVRRTAAVGGKSGGTLATLNSSYYSDEYKCFSLSCQEEGRLLTSSAVPYRDPSFSADSRTVSNLRQQELKKISEQRKPA